MKKYSQFVEGLEKATVVLAGQTLVDALKRVGVKVDVIRGDAIDEVKWELTHAGKVFGVLGELEYHLTYEIIRQNANAIVRRAVPYGTYGIGRIHLLPELTELALFGLDGPLEVIKLPERAVQMPYPMWVHSKSEDELTTEWMFTSEVQQAWDDYRQHMEMYLATNS